MDWKTKREIEKIKSYSQKDWYYPVDWWKEIEKEETKNDDESD